MGAQYAASTQVSVCQLTKVLGKIMSIVYRTKATADAGTE